MRTQEIFELACQHCGRVVQVPAAAGPARCPGCGGALRIEWREREGPPAARQLSAAEAAAEVAALVAAEIARVLAPIVAAAQLQMAEVASETARLRERVEARPYGPDTAMPAEWDGPMPPRRM